jgi:hypothetical protein
MDFYCIANQMKWHFGSYYLIATHNMEVNVQKRPAHWITLQFPGQGRVNLAI